MTENVPLITKYRPQVFEEVLGHDEKVQALRRAINSSTRAHAYLLTGASGIGKTTLARIIASEIGAEVTEIDAATNNGIDAMRELVELGQYMSLSGNASKMFILDECHALSRNSWQAILKLLEEPPDHLYIALCTTEQHKVPETIQTRCYHVPLRPLKDTEIEDLISVIAELEGWEVKPDILQVVVQGATGQPRKAISLLQSCYDAPNRDEAKRIISLMSDSEPVIDLLNYLILGKKSWVIIKGYLDKIDDSDFEECFTLAGRYIASAMMREEQDAKAQHMCSLLESLVFPASTYDRKVAFIAAIGRFLWNN